MLTVFESIANMGQIDAKDTEK